VNAGRDVERLIADWFVEEAVVRAPDRVLEEAGWVVDRTKQRRFGAARRAIPMSAPLRLAAAVVIGVIAIGGALLLLGRAGEPNVGGPPASPSPTSSAPASIAAATTPSNVATPTLPEGPLAAGTYVAAPLASALFNSCMRPPQPGCSESEDDSIRVTFTVPDGWAGLRGYGAIALAAEQTSSPAGASMSFGRGSWLHSNPCLTAEQLAANAQPDVAVGPGVDEFASAIADHPRLDATDPVPVTLGGFSGKYVDVQLPTDLKACPTSYFPWEPGIYAQGPGHRWHLWILDVDGVRVVVQATDYAGTSAEHRAELDSIVQSVQIEP
jgi:hypothetical protein